MRKAIIGIRDFQLVNVFDIRHQESDAGASPGSDDFVVAGVADQDNGVALARKSDRFQMDLGHQRAGGIDDLEIAA